MNLVVEFVAPKNKYKIIGTIFLPIVEDFISIGIIYGIKVKIIIKEAANLLNLYSGISGLLFILTKCIAGTEHTIVNA